MPSVVVLILAFFVSLVYIVLVEQIRQLIIKKSGFLPDKIAQKRILQGRSLAFILTLMVSFIAWLFLIDKSGASNLVTLIFFIQGVLFLNFYIMIVAEEFIVGNYPESDRDELMFHIVLATTSALMLIDFAATLLIVAIGFGYVLIYGL